MANLLKRYIDASGKNKSLLWQTQETKQYGKMAPMHYIAGTSYIFRTPVLMPKEMGALVEHLGTMPEDGIMAHSYSDNGKIEAAYGHMAIMTDLYDKIGNGQSLDITNLTQITRNKEVSILRRGKEYIYLDGNFGLLLNESVAIIEYHAQEKMVHIRILDEFNKEAAREIDLFVATTKIEEEDQCKYLADLAQITFDV